MKEKILGKLLGPIGALLSPLESAFARRFVLPRLTSRPHAAPELGGLPRFKPLTACKRIQYTFDNAIPGISVIVSPRECGKTTNLIFEFNDYISRGGHGKFFSPNTFSRSKDPSDAFFAKFGGTQRSEDLCDVLPFAQR